MKVSFGEALTKRATQHGLNDEQHEHLDWEMKQDGFPKTWEELRATASRIPWPFPVAVQLTFVKPGQGYQGIMHRLPHLNTYSTPLLWFVLTLEPMPCVLLFFATQQCHGCWNKLYNRVASHHRQLTLPRRNTMTMTRTRWKPWRHSSPASEPRRMPWGWS